MLLLQTFIEQINDKWTIFLCELSEAVNLELVNFNKPAGGVTKVEIGNDPYDEYFVPVNEHRKYMR